MRELIAPSIQLKDGSTYIPEGWMWLLAFAVQGHKWAVDEISKPECQIQIERWRREKIVQFYESERDDLEAAIAQLERDVAVVRDKINIVREKAMEETLKTIAETYPNDPSTAGMTLAYLPDKKKYYASICRYLAKYGEDKQVVAKGMADTASQAAAIACDIWRKIVEEEKRLASTTISGPQG